ncbi:hypothetical protein [Bacteroides reticulotermitis]|uniref:hypothetical protein n=1 Tax=Bacteroides reticulotermitis TaxID=1133319 RepID=UPI003A84BEDE
MKVLLYPLLFMFTICGAQNKFPINVKSESVNSIIITDRTTGIDTKVVDKQWIEELFDTYINTATEEPRIFVTKYKVSFIDQKQDYNLFVNSKYLKLEGATYKSNSDIEAFIQEKMNAVQ